MKVLFLNKLSSDSAFLTQHQVETFERSASGVRDPSGNTCISPTTVLTY